MSDGIESGGGAAFLRDTRLAAVMLLTFVGTVGVQVAPPALPALENALGVPEANVGWVVSAFFLPGALALPVVGVLADAYGRRTVALASLLLFGVAGTATAFAPDFDTLLLLRALQGVAFPGTTSLSITIAGDLYSGSRASTAQGMRISAQGVAATVVPVTAGVLAGVSWRYAFLLSALALPAFLAVYLALPETRDATDDGTDDAGFDLVGYFRLVAGELNDRSLAVLLVGGFAVFFVRYAVITFVPLFAVRSLDASSAVGGALLAVIGVVRIVVAPFSGVATARLSRRTSMLASVALLAVATAGMALASSVPVAGVLVAGYAVGSALFTPTLSDAVTSLASAERRAGVVNSMEVFKLTAIASSPAFFGVVLALDGFGAVFGIAGAVAVGYGLLLLLGLEPGVV